MRHDGPRRAKRPVVVIACSLLRVERCVRAACAPIARNVARVVVAVVMGDDDESGTLATCMVVAAVSTAGFGLVAAWTGVGSAELCTIASALVVGALAVGAATILVRRRLRDGGRGELRALLAITARQLLAEHARLPAARVLRVVLGPPQSAAQASVGVALAALAPRFDAVSQGLLLRLALRPATRMLPAVGMALQAHGTYRDSRDNARFVRQFALAAAALCPEPTPLPALCA
jgi:hypothetical protein